MEQKSFFNPIDKIMKTIKGDGGEKNQILFQSGDDDVDMRSDLIYPEDTLLCTLLYNDDFLSSKGLKPVYTPYLIELLRKRISLGRGSRQEFVNVNKRDFMDDNLAKLGSLQNLTEVRK